MDQVGKVEKKEGNMATILVKRVSACGDNCKSCGSSCNIRGININIEVTDDINIGDFVEISTETNIMLKHILVLYGTPLVIMLGTIFMFMIILKNNKNSDLISGLAGIASLFFSHILLKKYDKKELEQNTVKYTVAKKL